MHNISTVSGKPEMFYVYETPWHGLGTKVDDKLTSGAAIVAAGLNWNVTQEKLLLPDGTEIHDRVANVRMSDDGKYIYLASVGKKYQIIQNERAFTFIDEIIGSKEAVFETAGAIDSGRKVWISAKLNEDIVVGNDDRINQYLLFVNSHDGTMTCKVFWTPIRVVCQNTLTMALGSVSGNSVSIRHTGDILSKVSAAQEILDMSKIAAKRTAEAYNVMVSKNITIERAESIFKYIVPKHNNPKSDARTRNIREKIMNNFLEGKGSDMAGQTAWGAYNAIVEYLDHSKYEVKESYDKERRMKSIMFGADVSKKTEAMKHILGESWIPQSMSL